MHINTEWNWKDECRVKLLRCFPKSFFYGNGEFIAHKKSNTYFIFENCESKLDVDCKVLEWLSRAAYKTRPYQSDYKNDEFHQFVLDGINKYLDTNFSHENMEIIYTYLGNACNHKKTVAFVERGFDLSVLDRKYVVRDFEPKEEYAEKAV